MRVHLQTAALASMVVLAMLPNLGQAQIKPAIGGTGPKPGTTPASGESTFVLANPEVDYKHGKLLRLTLKGNEDSVIVGTVVREDKKSGQLFIRTTPGTPPRGIALNDITKQEKKIRKSTLTLVVSGKASTTPVMEDVANPEIQQMVILNGSIPVVRYTSQSLSPAEKSGLLELEQAQNEVTRLEAQSAGANRDMRGLVSNELALIAARRQTQELLNLQLSRLHWHDPLLWRGSAGSGAFSGGVQIYSAGQPTVDPSVIARLIAPATPDALTHARKTLADVRTRAVFEQDRLVAFIP